MKFEEKNKKRSIKMLQFFVKLLNQQKSTEQSKKNKKKHVNEKHRLAQKAERAYLLNQDVKSRNDHKKVNLEEMKLELAENS